MSDGTQELAVFLAERLRERADAIVQEWVDWIRERMANPVVEALSIRGLLNHIPPVIHSLGEYLVNPTVAVREDILGHLRMHGQIRRDQGYDVRDVMAELDGLSHLIMNHMREELLAAGDDCSVHDALTVFGRLSGGLRAMSFVTLSVYRDTEDDGRQELARHLAEFGRTIAHELRTPLNTIALSTRLLSESAVAEDPVQREQQVSVIRSAVKHAEGLLQDIDLLAMVENAHTVSRMTPLPAVLEAVREELTARADEREVSLEFDPEVPRLSVETVVAQLALTNVVNNAINYCDPEKESCWVRVRVEQDESEDSAFVRVVVSDNGVGIAPEYQSRVFQRHFRGHPERAEGTGLGLAITRELIEDRGGSIELDSEEGQGTTVSLRMRAVDVASIEAYTRGQSPAGLMHSAVRDLLEAEGRGKARDDDS